MKRTSDKRRAYLAEVTPDREMWRAEQKQACMGCGAKPTWLGLQIHEMCRKSHAAFKWANRCNYLLLCQSCHDGAFATAPHAYQLAVKKQHDPQNYDLKLWNELYYPSTPDRVRLVAYVTAEEVAEVYLEGT